MVVGQGLDDCSLAVAELQNVQNPQMIVDVVVAAEQGIAWAENFVACSREPVPEPVDAQPVASVIRLDVQAIAVDATMGVHKVVVVIFAASLPERSRTADAVADRSHAEIGMIVCSADSTHVTDLAARTSIPTHADARISPVQ